MSKTSEKLVKKHDIHTIQSKNHKIKFKLKRGNPSRVDIEERVLRGQTQFL